MHNHFTIKVIDKDSGNIKQEVTAYNMVLNQVFDTVGNKDSSKDFLHIYQLAVGDGNGIEENSRTSLFHQLKLYDMEFISRDEVNGKGIGKIIIPANELVGKTITEIGAYSLSYYYSKYSFKRILVSHAQLKDEEGNQISILKTDLDIVEIYYTWYLTTDLDTQLSKHPSNSFYLDSLYKEKLNEKYYCPIPLENKDQYKEQFKAESIGIASSSLENGYTRTTLLMGETNGNNKYYSAINYGNTAMLELPHPDFPRTERVKISPLNSPNGSQITFLLSDPIVDLATLEVYKNDVLETPTVDIKNTYPISYKVNPFSEDYTTFNFLYNGSQDGNLFLFKDGNHNQQVKKLINGNFIESEVLWKKNEDNFAISPNNKVIYSKGYIPKKGYINDYAILGTDGISIIKKGTLPSCSERIAGKTYLAGCQGSSLYIWLYKDNDLILTKTYSKSDFGFLNSFQFSYCQESFFGVYDYNNVNNQIRINIDSLTEEITTLPENVPLTENIDFGHLSKDEKTYLCVSIDGKRFNLYEKNLSNIWEEVNLLLPTFSTSYKLVVVFLSDHLFLVGNYYNGEKVWVKKIGEKWIVENRPVLIPSQLSKYSSAILTETIPKYFTINNTILMFQPETYITFSTPPLETDVITASYKLNGIHKTSEQRLTLSIDYKVRGEN